MSITLNVSNGFRIKEIEREGNCLDLSIIYLIDGEPFTKEEHVNVTKKQKENIVAKCLTMTMRNLDVETEKTEEERERIARKIMGLNIFNGYTISLEETEDENIKDVTVEFLINGEFYASTEMTKNTEEIKELRKRLRKIMIENFNLNNIRPIYLIEIIALIE